MSVAQQNNYINVLNERINNFKLCNNNDKRIQREDILNRWSVKEFNCYQNADILYNIIIGLEKLVSRYENIKWKECSSIFTEQEYSDTIALTDGQLKLLINTLINEHKLNYNCLSDIQVIYLFNVFDLFNYSPFEGEQFTNLNDGAVYIGNRDTPDDELIYDYTHNPRTRYDNGNMFDYFNFAIAKCFKYNRLNVYNQGENLAQLRDLIKIIISNNSIENKFKKFFRILDEEQILMIGF